MTRLDARRAAERTRLMMSAQWQALESQYPLVSGVVDRLADDPDYLDQTPDPKGIVQLLALIAKVAINKSRAEMIIDDINREEGE